VNVGVAAHITAASQGGPRFDPSLTESQRASHENGIWLCQNCAKLIDNDVLAYPATLLQAWKREAEENAARAVGKSTLSGLSQSVEGAHLHFVENHLLNPTALDVPLRVAFSVMNTGDLDAIFRMWDQSYFYTVDPSKTVFHCQESPPEELRVPAVPNTVWRGEFRFSIRLSNEKIYALDHGKARLFFYARGEYFDKCGIKKPLPFKAMYDRTFPGNLIAPSNNVRFV
jgi:hypothetical protein